MTTGELALDVTWDLLPWLQLLVMIGVLLLACRYRRLAPRMNLVIAGLLGLCVKSALYCVFYWFRFDDRLQSLAAIFCELLGPAAWIVLTVGLTRVWANLRDRFQLLHELQNESRPPGAETVR